MRRLCWFLAVVLFTTGCDYIEGLSGEGQSVTRDFEADAFEKIILNTSVRLVLTNDTSVKVVAEGPDFALSRLVVSQENRELIVESDGIWGFRKEQMPVLKVSSPDLEHIRSNFASEITNTDTLNIDKLRIVISGRGSFTECDLTVDGESLRLGAYGSNVGDHRFRGKVDVLNIVSLGLTSVDAGDLKTQRTIYHQGSVNPGYVHASGTLKVKMTSSGNVYYRGNPDIEIENGEPLYEVDFGEVIEYSD
ncbi:MAG: head GIN domain-containing protein [Marinilabilia sp.]